MNNSVLHWLSQEMRIYILNLYIHKGWEIKCARCGHYENLEFHHKHYEEPGFYDIELLCSKCHRGTDYKHSKVSTKFIKGKRYLITDRMRIQY
jgi:hypothetical protein